MKTIKFVNWQSKITFWIIGILLIATVYIMPVERAICGDLPEHLERRINMANHLYGKRLTIDVIPCENNYIDIQIKNDAYSDALLSSVHQILYDSIAREGWPTIIVYNYKREYLFSHSADNEIYRQTGD